VNHEGKGIDARWPMIKLQKNIVDDRKKFPGRPSKIASKQPSTGRARGLDEATQADHLASLSLNIVQK